MSTTKNNLKVISRNSPLALLQVREVFAKLPLAKYELFSVESFGDLNKQISLLDSPPADIFTRELDVAILDGKADIAVHSAKDLPYPLPNGLELIALLDAFDQSDVLVSAGNLKLTELPSGAKIGTSSAVRKRELLQIRNDLNVISIRGTIQERIALVDSGEIDALIVAGCAISRLGLNYKVAEVLDFETHPLQGFLAIIGRENSLNHSQIFSSIDIRSTYGKVSLVGFGPGNPDLLTVAGYKALEKADILFYDDLTNEKFLSKFKAAGKYVGKRSGKHSLEQSEINRLLLESARKGLNVVRLKGGDPSIFAHGGEEIDYLQSNFIDVKVIPGISSALASAAFGKFSLTHRNISSSVGFVTGHSSSVKLPDTDTLVIYMGANRLKDIARKALEQGRSAETSVLIAQNVSLENESFRTFTLQSILENEPELQTPLLIVIGDVVDVGKRNVYKKTVLYTGTIHPGNSGEKIIHQPLIELKILDSFSILTFVEQIKQYRWILFTSRYTVDFLFDLLYRNGLDARIFKDLRIASIGKTTSCALKNKGILPDLEPVVESSEGFLELIDSHRIESSKIIIPRSKKALPVIPLGLRARNWEVETVELYDNFLPENIVPVDLNQIDRVEFSSPSTVNNFKTVYGEFPKELKYTFKGKETEKRFSELTAL